MVKDEIWKDIEGYEGLYQISNKGRIRNSYKWDVNKRKNVPSDYRIMIPHDNSNGYLYITLKKNAKRKNYYIHRLVAKAFVPNPKNNNYVNHKDYDKRNNDASNLEWCTQKENVNYSRERMKHRRRFTHTNTGEMYISKRGNRYRLVIDKKEYPSFLSIEEAVRVRDEILKNEVM